RLRRASDPPQPLSRGERGLTNKLQPQKTRQISNLAVPAQHSADSAKRAPGALPTMQADAQSRALQSPIPAMPSPKPPPDALRQELNALSDALAHAAPATPSPAPGTLPPADESRALPDPEDTP